MQIIDTNNLIPDHSLLERVVETHPFFPNLHLKIASLILESDDSDIGNTRISFDNVNLNATLYIASNLHRSDEFDYILYHEFGHIADQVNPNFKYSKSKRDALSESENVLFKEIWNLYIDARLNHYGLFRLTKAAMGGLSWYNGKLQKAPFSIDGKLLRHINCLKSCKVNNADSIVRNIWDKPLFFMSYDDLIGCIRTIPETNG